MVVLADLSHPLNTKIYQTPPKYNGPKYVDLSPTKSLFLGVFGISGKGLIALACESTKRTILIFRILY